MSIPSCEVLVLGAGVIGSSVAMHLAEKGLNSVLVVDLDLEGTWSSSELNAGGVRATWTQPLNIEISKTSIEYFAKVKDSVGYHPCGYLWLHSEKRWSNALKASELQREMGWEVEQWDIPKLRDKRPFIDKTDDLVGALFAPKDGLVNPNLLKTHFREKARAKSVQFFDCIWIDGFEKSGKRIKALGKKIKSDPEYQNDDFRKTVLVDGRLPEGSYEPISILTDRIVNCTGAWAPEISKKLNSECPSKPYRRQISIFDCRDVDLRPYGMIVDPSGVYFHPEATNGLAGYADPAEPSARNFDYDGEGFFMEKIWMALYERSTSFEKLKHLSGWGGLYEVSPDESGIIGEALCEDRELQGRVFEAHSFSGHGAMQSYSVGRGIAEKMVNGRYETIDLEPLDVSRFSKGKLISENLVI